MTFELAVSLCKFALVSKWLCTSILSLPNPRGQLPAVMSPEVIKEANEAVEKAATSRRKGKQRGSYTKLTPDQLAAIEKYAAMHGNQAAIRHFSKDREVELKTVQTWKRKYQVEVDCRWKTSEMGDIMCTIAACQEVWKASAFGEKPGL